MILEGVQAGRPRLRPRPAVALPSSEAPAPGAGWRSAIFKTPVDGRVRIGLHNLEGDRQADLRGHGGPERAVMLYAAEHYLDWRVELGRDLPPGAFGENLTVSGGLVESQACLGDVLRIGTAVVQLSEVRGPCYKLAYRLQQPDIIARVLETGRGGIYARVLQEGEVAPGDQVELIDRPAPGWSAHRAYRAYRAATSNPAEARTMLDEVAPLSTNWRTKLERRLA